MKANDSFIPLGVISGAHGIKGAVKLRPFTSEASNPLAYDLQDQNGSAWKLKQIGTAKGQLICTIEGISDRNAAEKLKGTLLGAPRSALPAADEEGEFYIEDLVGMNVNLDNGAPYGTVKAVHNFGAGDIIEVALEGRQDEMYSFDERTFPRVNIAARTLTLSPPEVLAGDDKSS